MAVRVRGGWVRGPADLGAVAEQLGVPDKIKKIVAAYQKHREDWRAFLEQVEARFGPDPEEEEDLSIPPEVVATLGPPELLLAQPRGP
ncbi:hypothetical protein ABT294_34295 [Nonomuraea sp. NPDC000554]|uniref:hypothetical protein n=1 Tax=Nonomuraea sp. NPDC000554 TaxID=3154259 RepID=UPI00331AA48C